MLQLSRYEKSKVRIDGNEIGLNCVNKNIDLLWRKPPVYVAHASLYSIKWAEKFGQEDMDGMVTRCRMAFEDYDGFRRYIPKWYTDKYRGEFQEKECEE